MKSPIKESVNNFKALSVLKNIIPKGSVIDSFLFFSGNVELNLAESGRFIVAHTNKYVVYEFWKCAMENPAKIAEISNFLYPIGDEKAFHLFQENWPLYKDHYTRSALFFLLNRCSESGWISAGKFDDKNFNPVALSHLKRFSPKNFFLTLDKADTLNEAVTNSEMKGDYLLLPIGKFDYNFFEYGKSKGYEMTTVLHEELQKHLANIDKKWTVLYKNHPHLYKLYKDHNTIMIDKYGKRTEDKGNCEEVIFANF
tara:strand:+ start:953 stop:1717 length:765 start_codon:yes stop_codon:yes gene_type:complete